MPQPGAHKKAYQPAQRDTQQVEQENSENTANDFAFDFHAVRSVRCYNADQAVKLQPAQSIAFSTSTKSNLSTSNSPKSVIFNLGITGNAKNDSVINGARNTQPRADLTQASKPE